MRFATRILVGSFVPFTVLLAVAFYIVNTAAVNSVREAVRAGVRDNQLAVRALWTRSDNREQRILQGVADSPVLKAGLELIASNGLAEEQARNTVRDQLSEISEALRFDLMVVSSVRGDPLVGVVRQAHGFAALDAVRLHPPRTGLFAAGGQVYQLRSVPIFQGPAQVATLSVGELFDISRFGIPAVLLHQGEAISANSTDRSIRELGPSLRPCLAKAECQVQIGKQLYVSLRLASGGTEADGYEVRSLQNVDAASAGLQTLLKRLFLLAGLAALAAALGISFLASRSIARPLAQMALRLRQANALSDLPDFPATETGPQEIRDLAQGFNQAAEAVREGRERLTRAYVEFVGSLAQALDARDSYTAGHSRRVSEYSSAIAQAMGFCPQDVETIRVGALLHDIGKIGISDLVLQKPGRLTAEENEVIQRHPVIGRRILENVQGLEPYLQIVELHHENWDGTGYPLGLKGDQIPIQARIVKVADAYDAMTSDRPYRRGMEHGQAMAILRKVSGSETDGSVVEAFAQMDVPANRQGARPFSASLATLAEVVQKEAAGSERTGVQRAPASETANFAPHPVVREVSGAPPVGQKR